MVGFTSQVALGEMVAIARSQGLYLLDDLGSGCLLDTARYGLNPEPLVQESIAAGASLVFFSGDKLLGGPQAGLIVGKKELVDRLKKHPLARAIRIDKVRLAGMIATLMHYLHGDAETKIPVWKMISTPPPELRKRAQRWATSIGASARVEKGESLVGGGSLPGSTLPTWLLSIPEPARGKEKKLLPELSRRLRAGEPAVLCRIEKERLLLDPRTVLDDQDEGLLSVLRRELATLP